MSQSERDQLTADLRSGDATRVAQALVALDRAWKRHRLGPLRFPEPTCLQAFGERVPIEAVRSYLSVVMHYPDFEPTPASEDRRHALIEAVLQHGGRQEAFDVAIAVRIDDWPQGAVEDALRYIWARGIDDERQAELLRVFADTLLDSPKTRPAVVEMLRIWTMAESFPELCAALKPALDSSERAILDAAAEDE